MKTLHEIKSKLIGYNGTETLGANQIKIGFQNGMLFQSCNSIIVIILDGKVFLGEDWNYSATTSKYRNKFLNETTKETEAKIRSGEYTLLKD